MKKFFCALMMLIMFAAQICFATPQSLDRDIAVSRARQNFTLRSVEGDWYEVCIIGENEKMLSDWVWARDDEIFTANYRAYIGKDHSLTLQNVELFDISRYGNESRINMTRPNRDGFSLVKGVRGLPDLLVSKIQVTGGGYFDMRIFTVKNGRLQRVKFLDDDKKTFLTTFIATSSQIKYLNNGTISVPWHTNAGPVPGRYETIYMLDINNLILIPAYTNKL